MDITLTHDQEAWLKAEIAEGRFATPEDAISFAIESIARGGSNSADDARRAVAERIRTVP
jgi:hypothetical protein